MNSFLNDGIKNALCLLDAAYFLCIYARGTGVCRGADIFGVLKVLLNKKSDNL